MGYKKIVRRPLKNLRLNALFRGEDNVKDDMVASINSAKECYNFDLSTGALTPLKGYREVELKPFTRFWSISHFHSYSGISGDRVHTAVFVDSTGQLMSCNLDEYGNPMDLYDVPDDSYKFTSKPQMLSYGVGADGIILFCSPTDGLVSWKGGTSSPQRVENAPPITSMAMHNERLFATVEGKRDRVWFSDDCNPTNWTVSLDGAGYIDFSDERGDCEKVIAFGGYVYVFREYGISRITAYGEQSEFEVEHVFSSGSRICPSSVTLCANRIVFACDDGLFSFNGSSVTRIVPLLTGAFKFDGDTVSAFYKGKVYIAAKLLTQRTVGCEKGEYVNNIMIVYDMYTDKYNMYRGVDVRDITPVYGVNRVYLVVGSEGKVCVMSEANDFDGVILERKWRSPESDLGSSEKKMLKAISMFTEYDITVKVYTDNGVIEKNVRGKHGRSTVPINVSSHAFSIELVSTDYNCRIASPTLIYY